MNISVYTDTTSGIVQLLSATITNRGLGKQGNICRLMTDNILHRADTADIYSAGPRGSSAQSMSAEERINKPPSSVEIRRAPRKNDR